MRQRDGEFAQLLCCVWTATCTKQDVDVLNSKIIEDSDCNYPHDSLHVYRLNKDVYEQNIKNVRDLAPPENQHVVIHAIDHIKDKHTAQLNMAMSKRKAKTGGLIGELHIVVGAKVMLMIVMAS